MKYEILSKIYYKDIENYDKIYDSRFNSEATYKLPLKIHENTAFFITNLNMLNAIDSIYKTIAEINFKTTQLPSVAVNSLISKSLKDEIILTNEIEGVSSTRKEIEDAIAGQKNKKKLRFKGLATKYIKLIEDDEIPLESLSDIKKIYDELVLDEIDSDDYPDGEYFRTGPVSVVTATQKEKHKGIMPEIKINEYMETCLKLLVNEDLCGVVKAAVFHYFFGYIHPYYDGNGRTSRFISSCILKKDLGIMVALRLSYVIKDNIKKYYDAFDIANDFRNKGDLTHFILFFLELLDQASKDLNIKLKEAKDKLIYYSDIINSLNIPKKEEGVLFILCQDALYGDGDLSINALSEVIEMSGTSVRKIISNLSETYPISKRKIGHHDVFSIDLNKFDMLKA